MPVRAAVTLVATAVGVILLVSFRTPPSALPSAAVAPSSTSTSASPTATTTPSGAPPSGGTSPTPTATPTPAASGLRSGTFTGQTYSDQYGNLQVQVVISGGRITDVKVLQYPENEPQSSFISSQALPLLREEVLQAQSAKIDVVSGATFTSENYAASVQSALDLARA
ncbi:MAG: FMN-binding protein [Candidatus Dormibacteria bacterium]